MRKRCSSCGQLELVSESGMCDECDEAYLDSIQKAEQAFELGADYGRVMGWYDEPAEWEEDR